MTALDPDLHGVVITTNHWIQVVAKAISQQADSFVGPSTPDTKGPIIELARELHETQDGANPTEEWLVAVARMQHRTKRWAECIQTQRDAVNGRRNRRARRMDGLDGHPVIHLAEAFLVEAEARR